MKRPAQPQPKLQRNKIPSLPSSQRLFFALPLIVFISSDLSRHNTGKPLSWTNQWEKTHNNNKQVCRVSFKSAKKWTGSVKS
uniref:Uncharacterized protein n=1 Tax=Salix viminalis TaxID=40686 RepID=A0A6N2MEA2_SALVM